MQIAYFEKGTNPFSALAVTISKGRGGFFAMPYICWAVIAKNISSDFAKLDSSGTLDDSGGA